MDIQGISSLLIILKLLIIFLEFQAKKDTSWWINDKTSKEGGGEGSHIPDDIKIVLNSCASPYLSGVLFPISFNKSSVSKKNVLKLLECFIYY